MRKKKKAKSKAKKSKRTERQTRLSKKNIRVEQKLPLPPVHPWRLCPYGEHWVRTHPMHIPPSKNYPDGSITTRHEHCARNPSGKDQLYADEIQEIAKQNFNQLKSKPCPIDLGFHLNGNRYDDLIAGWVQYWNDVLSPDEPLDPNIVKALIASESSFEAKKLAQPKNSNSARGLTQITNESRKILDGNHGDLKDHFITVTKKELDDPNINICAGVRWLFEKRRLATSRLKKTASWLDAVWEYKGVNLAKTKEEAVNIKKIFNKFYGKLSTCNKN
jgi:Transglycosylase SLT domain